jgi:hypothetical protein
MNNSNFYQHLYFLNAICVHFKVTVHFEKHLVEQIQLISRLKGLVKLNYFFTQNPDWKTRKRAITFRRLIYLPR